MVLFFSYSIVLPKSALQKDTKRDTKRKEDPCMSQYPKPSVQTKKAGSSRPAFPSKPSPAKARPSSFSWITIFWMLLAGALMALIWYFSSRNGVQSQSQSDAVLHLFSLPALRTFSIWIRKSAHFWIYAALGGVWFLFFHSLALPSRQKWILAIAFAAGYAAIDELHQHFVPGRSGELQDVLLDSAGALLGILAASLLSFRLQKRSFHEG